MLIKTGITLALLSSPCFACQPGKFGSNCMQTCSTHCSGNGSCNQITGDCDNGCKDGWTGSKCGIQQNTDGSTDSFITITISSSVAAFSGAGITVGIVVYLFRRKKACFGKQKAKDIKIEYIQNAIFFEGAECQEFAKRYAMAAPPTSGPLAITSSM